MPWTRHERTKIAYAMIHNGQIILTEVRRLVSYNKMENTIRKFCEFVRIEMPLEDLIIEEATLCNSGESH